MDGNAPGNEPTKTEAEAPESTSNKPTDAEETKQNSSNSQSKSEVKTLPQELLVKHPLQYEWTLWYLKNEKNQKWEDSLKKVACFHTVEDFWALYNHIQLPSNLSWGSDYSLFKKGIEPTWEDVKNVSGGRWLIPVEKMDRVELLDHYWLELLIAVIGEQFDENGEIICGCVVNIRPKGDKISMWLENTEEEDKIMKIGRIIKEKLKIPDNQIIRFENHEDTKSRRSSHIKSKMTV